MIDIMISLRKFYRSSSFCYSEPERRDFMIEELLMNVVNAMSNSLDEEQLDKLQNVLYIISTA